MNTSYVEQCDDLAEYRFGAEPRPMTLPSSVTERAKTAGLAVLPYYLVYRALVRAEVAAIRASQPGVAAPEKREEIDRACGYLALAAGYAKPPQPALIITHGVSGSG